jgi:hypothetical protein
MEYFEQCVEIVCGLIDVRYEYGSIWAQARPQRFNRGPHGSERVLALRRSVVADYDWLVAIIERDLSNRLFEERQC